MNRRALAGAAAAIVCATALAASGGMLLASAVGSGPSGSVRATISSVHVAARQLDHVDAVQTAYGLTTGVATDLLALHALRGADDGSLDLLRPAADATVRSVTRSQLVDMIGTLQGQLADAARKLVVPREEAPAVRRVTAPFDAAVVRGVRAGTLTFDATPYASALQWMQGEVTRARDEASQARQQIQHAALPTHGSRNVALIALGLVMMLCAAGLAVVVVVGAMRHGELTRGAFTDVLTRTPNRRRLEDDLDALEAGTATDVAVLMVDVDHFKKLNDLAGHASGDRALARVAGAVSACLRRDDTLYRYGGEEFCVLLPGATNETAVAVADRIRAAVEAVVVDGEEHLPAGRLTVSIGVSTCGSPRDGIRAADDALYEAKQQGRNQVVAAGV